MPRSWVKLYCQEWLEGSISDESDSVIAVFSKILALAGRHDDEGKIALIGEQGYTQEQLAHALKRQQPDVEAALKRLAERGSIKISPANVIHVLNWSKYQSEYSRTRKYRKPVVANGVEKVQPENKSIDKEVYDAYESLMGGRVNTLDLQAVDDWIKTYSPSMVLDAIKEANDHNARSNRYIEKCLENWHRDGKKTEKPKVKSNLVDVN